MLTCFTHTRFGDNYPTRPYHKASYNSFIDYPLRGELQDKVEEDFSASKTPQRFILYGAVEGGPNVDDTWHDDRSNYEYSEVTQDYNAAWTGAIAGLIDYYGVDKFEPYTDCGLDLGWSHPNASAPPQWPEDDCYHTCNKNCPRGQMKSSFSWRLLMEPDKLDQNLEVLYPGNGEMRAAAVDGIKEKDPSSYHVERSGVRGAISNNNDNNSKDPQQKHSGSSTSHASSFAAAPAKLMHAVSVVLAGILVSTVMSA